ncbi:hypothetical protein PFISCL1PPCAC_6922, partial [Pristionchus fissidentatus]
PVISIYTKICEPKLSCQVPEQIYNSDYAQGMIRGILCTWLAVPEPGNSFCESRVLDGRFVIGHLFHVDGRFLGLDQNGRRSGVNVGNAGRNYCKRLFGLFRSHSFRSIHRMKLSNCPQNEKGGSDAEQNVTEVERSLAKVGLGRGCGSCSCSSCS